MSEMSEMSDQRRDEIAVAMSKRFAETPLWRAVVDDVVLRLIRQAHEQGWNEGWAARGEHLEADADPAFAREVDLRREAFLRHLNRPADA